MTVQKGQRLVAPRGGLHLRRIILDQKEMARSIRRIACQIVEGVDQVEALALIGVRTRGVPIARRIQAEIADLEGVAPLVGELDIALYRDDVFDGMPMPEVRPTLLPFEVQARQLILVDDVLYTGRTIRAALDALMDWGRPRWIRLATLVDRGHRELPVQADYSGCVVETSRTDSVQVCLEEVDGVDEVRMWSRDEQGVEP
ncbi:MAG: bifunctional pyr operon transcriptional regulator/uracil phosphoribosyltransferase PyrR [Myxococcota bacterium]|nr:bifunctional pyr operon transcriptional regulator/uracil phosphoribosyltransferase PyrR [Myxococcota bacterium]